MKAYWRTEGTAPHILGLGIRRRWVVSFTPRPLYPQERATGTYCTGVWVGPTADLDTVVKRKIPSPCQESNPRIPIVQPVASRYTDWVITALISSTPELNMNFDLPPYCSTKKNLLQLKLHIFWRSATQNYPALVPSSDVNIATTSEIRKGIMFMLLIVWN
jgi:hypothetical protein